jgi:hypothetical protein
MVNWLFNGIFQWLRMMLGIDRNLAESKFQFRVLEEKINWLQNSLNAMQVDKLKVYVQDKAKPVAMDYESSQQAALDEFKDEK